jgi:hypothetical protein
MRTLFFLICLTPFSAFCGDKNEPVYFTENRGQIHDQHSNARHDVLFAGSCANGMFYLRENGISYQLYKNYNAGQTATRPLKQYKDAKEGITLSKVSIYRLDITWKGAEKADRVEATGARSEFTRFYNGSVPRGTEEVRSFNGVKYTGIYAGIDVVYSGHSGLKYDFIVQAGADPEQIQLVVAGADAISIEADGSLRIETPLGDVHEAAPVAFQGERKVAVKWRFAGNTLSFDIGTYDRSSTLVIDPAVRVWGSYFGGAGEDHSNSCVADGSGNIYIAGWTTTTGTVLATTGAHSATMAGSYDAFLAKFDANGQRVWATYYGGDQTDIANGCALDLNGNIYIAGGSASAGSVVTTSGAFQTSFVGGEEALLVKFNSSGVRIWATFYGHDYSERANSVSTDKFGNVFLFGTTSSTASAFVTSGAHQTSNGGGSTDAFLVKFSPTGARRWATYYGGSGTESGNSCAADTLGNVFIAGVTVSSNTAAIATSNGHQTSMVHFAYEDAFLAKLDSTGVRQWGTYYGNYYQDGAYACTVDPAGDVYLSGYTTTWTNNPMGTPGSHQPTHSAGSGFWDGFLAKFSTNGTRIWSTYYGGSGDDSGTAIDTDAQGNVFLAGNTVANTTTLIATPGSHQSFFAGSEDAYFAKFNSAGVRQWGTYYGGTAVDNAHDVSVNKFGSIFLTGRSIGSNTWQAVATSSVFQSSNPNWWTFDGFVVKFDECTPGIVANVTPTSALTRCGPGTTTLSVSSTTTTYWYTSVSGGSAFATGTSIVTSTLSPGTHSYYVESPGTCTFATMRQLIAVQVHTLPVVSVNSGSICQGESFTIVPTGASTYSFSGGTAVVAPMTNTTYTVTGFSSTGCSAAATVSVNVAPSPTLSISASNHTICAGTILVLSSSGADTYSWSIGGNAPAITHTPGVSTTYSVSGTNTLNGCSSSVSIHIHVDPSPTVSVVGSSSVCAGHSATLIASGADSYIWNTNAVGATVIVVPTTTTTYMVIGTNSLGCTHLTSFTVASAPLPALGISGSTTICLGSTATWVATGAQTFTWSTLQTTPTVTLSPQVTTVYSLQGTAANGCTAMAISMLGVFPPPVVAVVPHHPAACTDEFFVLTASGAFTYTWSHGIQNGMPFKPGTPGTFVYTVTGTDANGCTDQDVTTLIVELTPTVTISSSAPTLCVGSVAILQATGATTYIWMTSETSPTIQVAPAITSTYAVIGTETNGCSDVAEIGVVVSACAGIEESELAGHGIKIWPNPVAGELHIYSISKGNCRIMDLHGRVLLVKELNEGENVVNLDKFAEGIYFVEIVGRKKQLTTKTIIDKKQ